jgi:hypothetical protein
MFVDTLDVRCGSVQPEASDLRPVHMCGLRQWTRSTPADRSIPSQGCTSGATRNLLALLLRLPGSRSLPASTRWQAVPRRLARHRSRRPRLALRQTITRKGDERALRSWTGDDPTSTQRLSAVQRYQVRGVCETDNDPADEHSVCGVSVAAAGEEERGRRGAPPAAAAAIALTSTLSVFD